VSRRATRWELQEEVTDRLEEAGVPTPEVDARLLLDAMEERFGDVSRCDRAVLDGMVARRAAREPLQVVLGRTTFRWVDVEVERGVFVPRPETEVVAGLAIEACERLETPRVVEPCTGTGAIACALLTEVPGVRVLATDASIDAVELARRNVARVLAGDASPPDRRPRDGADAEVVHGHLLEPLQQLDPDTRGRVDVLVANPPYLPTSDAPSMDLEVVGHDPHGALFGGDDGHEVVDELLREAMVWLRPGGTVVLEIDDRRGADAARAAEQAGLTDVRIEPDLTGRDRAVVARRPA
jgi:release factor glutamine methyltransferase